MYIQLTSFFLLPGFSLFPISYKPIFFTFTLLVPLFCPALCTIVASNLDLNDPDFVCFSLFYFLDRKAAAWFEIFQDLLYPEISVHWQHVQ